MTHTRPVVAQTEGGAFESLFRLLDNWLSGDAEELFKDGVASLSEGQLDDAEHAFLKSLKKQPQQLSSYFGLADVAHLRGNAEKAEEYLQIVRAMAPNHPLVWRAWGQHNLLQGKLAEAEHAFEKYQTLAPDAPLPLLELGNFYVRAKRDADKALKMYRQAVEVAPNNANAHYTLGLALFGTGKPEQAEASLREAARLAPENKLPLMTLARMYLDLKNYDKALAVYAEILQKQADFLPAFVGCGDVWLAKGEDQKAMAEYGKALQKDAKYAAALVKVGMLHYKHKNYDKALKSFDLVLEQYPGYSPLYVQRGDILSAKGENQKALADYKKAVKTNPKDGVALVRIASLYHAQKDFDQAEQAYLTAIKVDPRQVIAYNNLAMLAIERKRNLDQALEWAKKAVELAPKSPDLYDTLGWVYYARGELDLALATLEKAVSINPNAMLSAAEIFYHLGVVYMEAGNKHQAAQTLQKALSLDKSFAGAPDAMERLTQLQ